MTNKHMTAHMFLEEDPKSAVRKQENTRPAGGPLDHIALAISKDINLKEGCV